MKKWFDKYVAQSSKGQMTALAIAFVALVLLGSLVGRVVLDRNDESSAGFGRPGMWGMMHFLDASSVSSTISANAKVEDGKVVEVAPLAVVAVSVVFCFCGMVLMSFFTGVATDFLNSRREKILAGDVDYVFDRDYVLVVGYDFQVKHLLRTLFSSSDHKGRNIVLVTDTSVEDIYEDILPELSPSETRRLYVMRKDIALADAYSRFTVTGASAIFVIGDGGAVGRDGKTLQALGELTTKAKSEKPADGLPPIKVYLHVEDSALYSQVRAIALPPDECPFFDLAVYNYYESWAWECWSRKDAADADGAAYLPLRHRPGTDRAELFVIGAGRMGRAMVNFALPLLNYGRDGEKNRVTIFDADPLKNGFLPDRATLEALPETEVRYLAVDGCSDEANDIMLEAALRDDTSVTVVVALSDPGAAIRAYSELSNRLRRRPVSVLVWQATYSKNCPAKKYLRMGGADSAADKTELRYFGMMDVLPWRNATRFEAGKAINFYYWRFYEADPGAKYPPADDEGLLTAARTSWDASRADALWLDIPRWKKWSSVNSGDTLREKSVLLNGAPYPEAARRILVAEHNRWWTERLLAGWQLDGKIRDKAKMLHTDMVPFGELSAATQDKDKINIAALAHCGY